MLPLSSQPVPVATPIVQNLFTKNASSKRQLLQSSLCHPSSAKRSHLTKGKTLQTHAALNAQDNWTLLDVDDTNEIQFDYQPVQYRLAQSERIF